MLEFYWLEFFIHRVMEKPFRRPLPTPELLFYWLTHGDIVNNRQLGYIIEPHDGISSTN